MEAQTCSSSDRDAARLRDFARLSTLFREALLVIGLSGGDNSELGVVLVTAVDRSSESSHCLSNIGSLIWLSGESDILIEAVVAVFATYAAAPKLECRCSFPWGSISWVSGIKAQWQLRTMLRL